MTFKMFKMLKLYFIGCSFHEVQVARPDNLRGGLSKLGELAALGGLYSLRCKS